MNKFKITLITILFGSFSNILLSIGTEENPYKLIPFIENYLENKQIAPGNQVLEKLKQNFLKNKREFHNVLLNLNIMPLIILYKQILDNEMVNIITHYNRLKKDPTKKLSLLMQLIRKGARSDTYFGETLRTAVKLNRLDIVKELVEEHKANINGNLPYGDMKLLTPLNTAIVSPKTNLKIAEYLINHGADVNSLAVYVDDETSERFTTKGTGNPYNIVGEFTPLEQIIIDLTYFNYSKRTLNKFINTIRTLLCKNAKFDENKILKYYPNYKKKLPPVILRLFDRAKELRAQKIEESTSCPMDLARIISEYAAEQMPETKPESKEEKEDKEREEES